MDALNWEWESSVAGMAMALYDAGAPPPAVREALRMIWIDPKAREWLTGAWHWMKHPGKVRRAFRYAAFPLPDDTPSEVTVYRGLYGRSGEKSMFQMAMEPHRFYPPWTTDRDAACAIATAYPEKEGVVVRCVIPRESIIYSGISPVAEDLPYPEILFDAEPTGQVDGTWLEWRYRQDYVTARRMGCPVVGPVGTGPDEVENLKQAMDFAGRRAFADLLTRGSADAYNAELWSRDIPLPLHGAVTLALYRAKAPPENVRGMFHITWTRGYRRIMDVLPTHDALYDLIRYAGFPIPADLPEKVVVYRGTAGVTVDQARQGRSWTMHRPMACYFATIGANQRGHYGTPLVIRREVRVGDALFFADDGLASELVFDPDRCSELVDEAELGVVDGEPEEWLAHARQFDKERTQGRLDDTDRRNLRMVQRVQTYCGLPGTPQ